MKEERNVKSEKFCHIGFYLFIIMFFLTISVPITAQEKSNQFYWSGMGSISNQAKIKNKPRVSPGKLIGEICMGIVGNVILGYAAFKTMHLFSKSDKGVGSVDVGGAIGYLFGSTFGSALGVYIIGNSRNVKGSFQSALLGSFLGQIAAISIAWLFNWDENATQTTFLILPPIGAALLFNRSLRYKSSPVSNALLNFNKGDFKIGIPYVHMQLFPSYAKKVKPTVRFKINLLNITF